MKVYHPSLGGSVNNPLVKQPVGKSAPCFITHPLCHEAEADSPTGCIIAHNAVGKLCGSVLVCNWGVIALLLGRVLQNFCCLFF
jgi:hypothetical protein